MTRVERAQFWNRVMTGIFYLIAVFFIALLIAFAVYILSKGLTVNTIPYIFDSTEGIENQLFNTIYLVVLALLISVPIGVLTGIYMAEYAKANRITKMIRISIETLSSLPSIVVGLFGYLVFILATGAHWSLFAGALTVSIINIPIITTTTEDALKALPKSYAKASYGLGATKWQTISRVLIPAAIPQIVTGIILAAGRTFGEAAALLYTAGLSTDINWHSYNLLSPTHPLNPFRPGETLALHIWTMRTEALAHNATDIANLSAAILLILVFTFNMGARVISKYMNRNN